MKAIAIKFEGIETLRYSVIANEDKFGFCFVSEKASHFIKAQSIDGNVYQGTEVCNDVFCRANGDITRYYVKSDVYDETNPFAMPKEGEWQWKWVEIRVIDIMD